MAKVSRCPQAYTHYVLNALRRQILWQFRQQAPPLPLSSRAQRLTATDLVAMGGEEKAERINECSTPYGDRSCGKARLVLNKPCLTRAQRLTATDLVATSRSGSWSSTGRSAQRLTATDLVATRPGCAALPGARGAQRLTATDLVATKPTASPNWPR